MENKKFNYKTIYTIYIIIFCIIFAYFIGWYIICKKYKNYAIEKIDSIPNLSYKKVSLNGFPFKFGLKFKDLQMSSTSYGVNVNFSTNKLQFSKPLFDNIVKIGIDNIKYEAEDDRIIELIIEDGNALAVEFKDKQILSINAIVPSITIKDSLEKNKEMVIKNMIYKAEEIKNDSYINRPNFLDVEKILTYTYNDGKQELQNELNFSLDLSLISIIENESVLSSGIDLNKAVYNDITNNYSLNFNGEYKSNSETIFSLLFNIDMNNYDNFINSLKDPVKLETAKNLENIIPNMNNGEKNRHITIKKAVDFDTIMVNEKSLNNIIGDILTSINQ